MLDCTCVNYSAGNNLSYNLVLKNISPRRGLIFFGRGYDLENFQCINFFWIVKNYGSSLLHQPCLVARDVCQKLWRVVTAIIAWVFVRDGDLDSTEPNVLPLHATVHACLT